MFKSLDGDALLEVEGVDRHVADIGDAQGIERRRPRRHVVGADQAGFGADLTALPDTVHPLDLPLIRGHDRP